jgi:dTDP-4-amino-4,6-dideoxygalactose transaminase
VLRIDFESIEKSRQRFIEELKASDIGSQVHYMPVPMHPVYSRLGHDARDYTNAMKYYSEALSIPLYYSLTESEQTEVIDAIKGLLA